MFNEKCIKRIRFLKSHFYFTFLVQKNEMKKVLVAALMLTGLGTFAQQKNVTLKIFTSYKMQNFTTKGEIATISYLSASGDTTTLYKDEIKAENGAVTLKWNIPGETVWFEVNGFLDNDCFYYSLMVDGETIINNNATCKQIWCETMVETMAKKE